MDDFNKDNQRVEVESPVSEEGLGKPGDLKDGEGIAGFFDLIYGVVFQPAGTFRLIGQNPPIIKVVIIFSIIQVLSMLLFILGGVYSGNNMAGGFPGMAGFIKAALFVMAFGGFVFAYIKWFLYSSVFYFLAQLIGGSGKALGTLAVTGLASIPVMLLSPLQLLLILLGGNWWAYLLSGLIMTVTAIWFIALLVIGLRETQQLSSGKALAVVFIPVATIIVLSILLLTAAMSLLGPALMYFQELGGGI